MLLGIDDVAVMLVYKGRNRRDDAFAVDALEQQNPGVWTLLARHVKRVAAAAAAFLPLSRPLALQCPELRPQSLHLGQYLVQRRAVGNRAARVGRILVDEIAGYRRRDVAEDRKREHRQQEAQHP